MEQQRKEEEIRKISSRLDYYAALTTTARYCKLSCLGSSENEKKMVVELAKVAKKNTNNPMDVQLFFMTVGSK